MQCNLQLHFVKLLFKGNRVVEDSVIFFHFTLGKYLFSQVEIWGSWEKIFSQAEIWEYEKNLLRFGVKKSITFR